MRRSAGLVVVLALAAAASPAADHPRPRPADRPVVLSDAVRAELRSLLKHVARKAKPEFPRAAMTFEQARHYADVSPKLTWQCEFDGWFVFAVPGFKGGPDPWSGVIFVQKGTNLVGYYRETW